MLSQGEDITIIACGEMVRAAQNAALELKSQNIGCRVLDMHCFLQTAPSALLILPCRMRRPLRANLPRYLRITD